MSALKLAVSALNREKPHSSITDWVEILTSPSYLDEAYDGIPELATSIHLQSTGPSEASRAIRKKIKHGDNHQKYRALVILKALMENGDHKFQTACMDDHLVDAIKQLASDPAADIKVKRKLLSILASWSTQFNDDPSLSTIAGLYKQARPIDRRSHGRSESTDAPILRSTGLSPSDKDAAKKRVKREKEEARERARKAEEEARQRRTRQTRTPFNFALEKPKILTSIASASQASSNLVNAIMLVNGDKESITVNPRVQECLEHAKAAGKTIVQYIQLVENEEVIGTLIETNERIVSALQMYDDLSVPQHTQDPTGGIRAAMNGIAITPGESERAWQPRPVSSDREDARDDTRNTSEFVHPDLQDLSFGGLTSEQASLPPPLQPFRHDPSSESVWDEHRGSLSDFSDYESDEEPQPARTHHLAGPSSGGKSGARALEVEDPFADPFAD